MNGDTDDVVRKMNLRLLAISCAVFFVGCTASDMTYFEHAGTSGFEHRSQVSNAQKDPFDDYSDFVFSGMLFVPSVRELAWQPDHRAFVNVYSRKQRRIRILEASLSSIPNKTEVVLERKQWVDVRQLDESTGLYRGSFYLGLKHVGGSGEVISGEPLMLRLKIEDSASRRVTSLDFRLDGRIDVGRCIADVFAAA